MALNKKRENSDNALSFLDIMACGLGAVILIFLIIEHNIDSGGSAEVDALLDKLESMEQESERLSQEVENVAKLNADEERLGEEMEERQQSRNTALAAIDQRMSAQEQQKRQLNQSKEDLEKKIAESVVASPDTGGEKFLIGLSVEGKHNVFIIDHSGSMTADTITQATLYKVRDPATRRSAPKWVRAKKAILWMIDRLPADSTAVVIAFAEEAHVLGGVSEFGPSDVAKIQKVQAALEQLDPKGGGNLQAAFELAIEQTPTPTDYYLVTDGLPTKPGQGVRDCANSRNRVPPACRRLYLGGVANVVSRNLKAAGLNVMLLPLQGDWEASHAYWRLTLGRGMVISPAQSWP